MQNYAHNQRKIGTVYRDALKQNMSNMIDGTIARKTGAASSFGARLDTVADFLLVIASFAKILPVIRIPVWIWVWAAVIAVVKLVNLVWGILGRKQMPALHTIANKATGLFLLPLTISFVDLRYTAPVVCVIATIATIQEGRYIVKGSDIV